MPSLRWLRLRLRSLIRGRAVRAELDRELSLHMEQLVREAMDDGLSEADARRAARKAFGPSAVIAEECLEARRVGLVEDFVKDARYAIRLLERSPGFALTAVLSLALGLGANTAIFSVVDAVLLRTLPVSRAHELVFVEVFGTDGRGGGAPPYPCFERFRNETTAFADLAAFSSGDQLRVEIDGQIEQVIGQVVSGSYFSVLGIGPSAGRLLNVADEESDAPVAVLGHSYWQRRFGGSPAVFGRTISFNGRAYTIVGATPPDYTGLFPGRRIDVTLPMLLTPEQRGNAGAWWFDIVARVRSGASVAQARAQTDAVFQSFMKDHPRPATGPWHFDHIELTPAARGLDTLRSRYAMPLYALSATAAVVLLLACVNLGNLLLVRGATRARELAIRRATGAGAGRLVRQLLTETLVLFAIGLTAGLVVSHLLVNALAGAFAIGRNPILLDVRYDWRLALFAAGVTFVTAGLTGLWPAIRAWHSIPQDALRDGHGRVAGSRRSASLSRLSIASQMALSLVLLVTAVIFVRTMTNLRAVDLGFNANRVLTMSLYPVFPETGTDAARQRFWDDVLTRVRNLPGVRAASLSVLTPLSGRDTGRAITVDGFVAQSQADRTVRVNHVSDDYFRTFGIDVRAGRPFTRQDDQNAARVAIINETAARAYFAGRHPVGQAIRIASSTYTVVGVAQDHKHRSLREAAPPTVSLPITQPLDRLSRVTLAVSSDQPASLAAAVAEEVRAVDPATLVSEVLGVQEQIDATLVSERLVSSLASGFALLALGIAAIGLYGVLTSVLATRRPEFAVRMALGARPSQLAGGLARELVFQVAIGTAIGLPLAFVAARSSTQLLFGVNAADPWHYVAAIALLGAAAAIAAWLPARRMWSISPSEALRGDA